MTVTVKSGKFLCCCVVVETFEDATTGYVDESWVRLGAGNVEVLEELDGGVDVCWFEGVVISIPY